MEHNQRERRRGHVDDAPLRRGDETARQGRDRERVFGVGAAAAALDDHLRGQ